MPTNAADNRPEHALALARLAELSLSLSDYSKALAAAHRATAVAPNLGRTQVVMGFAALSVVDITGAKAAFQKAIEVGSDDPLAHLGLGLAQIRDGDFDGGAHRDRDGGVRSARTRPSCGATSARPISRKGANRLTGASSTLAKELGSARPDAVVLRCDVANRPSTGPSKRYRTSRRPIDAERQPRSLSIAAAARLGTLRHAAPASGAYTATWASSSWRR